MKEKLWLLTIIGSTLGGLIAIFGVLNANGAPQECSSAAIGLALAVIPYCLARAVAELGGQKNETEGSTKNDEREKN